MESRDLKLFGIDPGPEAVGALMSIRLQVVLEASELREIRQAARRQRLTVSEWVRRCLRDARRRQPGRDAGRKLQAIRAAARHAFPTAEIEQMLAEIEGGYLGDPSGS